MKSSPHFVVLDRRGKRHDADRRVAHETECVTHVIRWNPMSAFGFNVVDICPPSPHIDYIIYPMPYDYRIDALVILRLQILARVTGRRVVGVETPGVTMDFQDPATTGKTAIPPRAVGRTLCGDYSDLVQMQWHAIAETTNLRSEHARYLGESLGAQMAAASYAARPAISLDLVEPVNTARLTLGNMLRLRSNLIGTEARQRLSALEQNQALGWGQVTAFELASSSNAEVDRRLKRFTRQGRWVLTSAFGLRTGLAPLLNRLPPAASFRVWRASESAVCSHTDVAELATKLEHSGHHLTELTMTMTGSPAGHHVLTNLDAMTGFSRALLDRWDED